MSDIGEAIHAALGDVFVPIASLVHQAKAGLVMALARLRRVIVELLPQEDVSDRGEFLWAGVETEAMDRLQRHERTGSAPGSDRCVARLERMPAPILRPRELGHKPTPDAR